MVRMWSPLKARVCSPLKARTCSTLKEKGRSPLKARTSSPLKARACSPLKVIGTSTQGSTLMRKQEIDSSRGLVIPNPQDLDIRCRKSMQLTWFLGMRMHATFVVKFGKCRLHMKQCNVMESLYNVHDILSLFYDFDWIFFVFLENTDWLSFWKRW